MKVVGSQPDTFLDPSQWSGRIFNGTWIQSKGGVQEVIEPATGNLIGIVGVANVDDIDAACRSAATSQLVWFAMQPDKRAAILRRAGELFVKQLDELAFYIARETGAILSLGRYEVRHASKLLHLAADIALQPQRIELPTTADQVSYAQRVPHGVVGVISPFNLPLILSLRVVAPALATGNAVVLKPDLKTPVTGGFMIASILHEAGLPAGVLQVLPGDIAPGEALCIHQCVGMVSFTGSTEAGRRVGELAGKNLKKVSLELGGKNALIILDDVDLDQAASNIAWGAWLHQGQICLASGRIIVHESIAAELTKRLVSKAQRLKLGDPTDPDVALGPLISERHLKKVHSIVRDTVAAGATLAEGGTFNHLFYRPTVLTGVQPGMRAFSEEIFGPVVNLVSFRTDEEAVTLANDTEYGLAASVFSKSIDRAMALGARLKTGLLHINDQTVKDDGTNPFGGRGISGNGTRVGGPIDLEEYTQWQWVTVRSEPPAYGF